ncbi:hypothetical protein ACFQNE_17065, partial [Gordonia phosphorivorans]
MDAVTLTAFADLLSDDLTIPVGTDTAGPANLGQFLARARAVDDDRELLAGESPGVVGFGGSLRAVDTPESLVSPL